MYDAIIVGAGHNGLVTAAYLAKAGRRVLVLEQRSVIGGAAVTEEVFPGFHFSVCLYVVSLFRPHIIRELELTKHGMQLIPLECSFTPHLDGPGLVRWSDANRTRREVARFSRKDAEISPEFALAMSKMSFFVKHIIDNPPPALGSMNPNEVNRLLKQFMEMQRVMKQAKKMGAKFGGQMPTPEQLQRLQGPQMPKLPPGFPRGFKF